VFEWRHNHRCDLNNGSLFRYGGRHVGNQDRKSKVAHGIFFGSQEKYSKNIEQNVDKCSGFFEKINQIKLKNQNF
jgi:hypothetical protein